MNYSYLLYTYMYAVTQDNMTPGYKNTKRHTEHTYKINYRYKLLEVKMCNLAQGCAI